MKKLHFAILQNEIYNDHLLWEQACQERAELVSYSSVDLTRSDWLEVIKKEAFDGLLAVPPAQSSAFKTLYDERVRILHTVLKIPIYPSLEEIEIYENKKYFSYWAKARQIPHPATQVFYFEKEAIESLEQASFPVVAKTSIGASGRGVSILKSKEEAQQYVRSTFSGEGANRSVGPKWRKKGFVGRVIKKLLNPTAFKAKLQQYKNARNDVQKDFVIFQEFIPHDYEWRCVRIGDSFFAHKKLMAGEKASGSLLKGYDNPPLALMDFVKEVTDAYGFYSQAVDIFERDKGYFLINEMQCIFGQSDPYQMKVDDVVGRYIHQNDRWVFEAGDFNGLESYLLRIDHFIELLTAKVPAVQSRPMKPIGGFLEFELPQIGQSFHPEAVALSTGRGGIRFMLQHLNLKKCYVPFYSCDSVLSPFRAEGIDIVFYEIDEQLDPKELPVLEEDSYFLYINFFGIKGLTVDQLSKHYGEKLLIDNVHLFFSKGFPNNWSFTSARKYFGVPDGAYVYPPQQARINLPADRYKPTQINHLVNRLIGDRELAYRQNVIHEESLQPEVKIMSTFSEKMLNTIDYESVQAIRQENFAWLHQQLSPYNQLIINVPPKTTCFRYPFLPSKLISKSPFYQQQLFIPSFWSDVHQRPVEGFEWEKRLSQQLFPLPIDHRYRVKDLQRLVDFILQQL